MIVGVKELRIQKLELCSSYVRAKNLCWHSKQFDELSLPSICLLWLGEDGKVTHEIEIIKQSIRCVD